MTKYIYDRRYPSIADLKRKAKARIPKFAFDYLEGGCNEELNLQRNESDFDEVLLEPRYLRKFNGVNMQAELFGKTYDAPIGISPIGLQGLMWPNAPEILAKAAYKENIPYVLSTVSTSSIERIAELTQGEFWFQLYHPAEDRLRDDILDRLQRSGCKTLVVLIDVPSFGLRYREIKAGLSMPPKMTISNILQATIRPNWSISTLIAGIPEFATLKPYMETKMDMSQLGAFMDRTFVGRVNEDKVRIIRDKWKGNLVLKGVASEEDAAKAAELGADGIIVSNHGGRQVDAGESSLHSLKRIVDNYKDKYKVMMDGGVRSGPDIARALALGAEFVFMGRPFMYGVSALGAKGGDHTIALLKAQLYQAMEQLGCEKINQMAEFLLQHKDS
ncbi:MAG TPA: alpha-hydroxy-acid oxidizing protein [Candidatus Sphingobacterium stercoripullorum]|uniref:Alpha-hydroxy-acid oxidizing protein n=1 Tax=Candidatus Sphingobacterium stercoripullorum TaxID=2838759 RepID=A0A9D2AYG9_9SPHI|nr:alpha-hydroxy-acid oxidizing protein [Candidatus Sphingobacterium stercoripullorum]